MKTRELTDISYDIADLSATIGIMQNYISCLSSQALRLDKNKNNNEIYLLFYSLTNEHGLHNILDNLEILDKKINKLSNEVLNYAEVSA